MAEQHPHPSETAPSTTAPDTTPSAQTKSAAAPEQPSFLKRGMKVYGVVSDILTPTRLALLLGAVLIAVVSFFGGWDAATATADDVALAVSDEPINAEPFELTLQKAFVFTELEPAFPAVEGVRYVAVTLDARNTSDLTVAAGVLARALKIDAAGLASHDFEGEALINDPSVVRLEDSLSARSLQPDLPVQVVLVWQQSSAEAAPSELKVAISKHTWRKSTLDDGKGWFDPAHVATVKLPVGEPGGEQ